MRYIRTFHLNIVSTQFQHHPLILLLHCACVCVDSLVVPHAHALMHLDMFFCRLTRSIGPYLDI